MTESIHFSCQGESHKATNKVCQDYSYSKIYEDNIGVAIVCDGHGGKRYFRSDVGARLAAEITERNLLQFLRNVGNVLISNRPFTSSGSIATQIELSSLEKQMKLRWHCVNCSVQLFMNGTRRSQSTH